MKIVKTELYDPDVMEALLRDTKSFSKKDLQRLSLYKKQRKHGNKVEVVYHYGKGCDKYQLGRLYAKDNQGLQSFPFDIRNPLLEANYFDIDMECCHHNLMVRLGKEWGIVVKNIEYYCQNRDKCLNELSSGNENPF